MLLAEACNTGHEPLIREDIPALRRDRLSWADQNYIRDETLTAANAILVAAQNQITLAHAWGGGDVASADGMRFVVPVRTVHAGPNPKYFGRGRGVTWYNMLSNQFTGLNGIVAPGTLRDSLILLAVVLEQETELTPTRIMTDTGAYSDVVFGLFRLLGYRFSPRLADIGGTRFWRIDPHADYGDLNALARQRVNTSLFIENWDDMLRLIGSLKLGRVPAMGIMRSLQVADRPTRLAQAVAEFGRIEKTLHVLTTIDDEEKRRATLAQLNRGEGRHSLARVVFHGKRGELRQRYREGQEDQLGALGARAQRHRALEHDLHRRCSRPAPQGRLPGARRGRGPPLALGLRPHQHARSLLVRRARRRASGRAASASRARRRRLRGACTPWTAHEMLLEASGSRGLGWASPVGASAPIFVSARRKTDPVSKSPSSACAAGWSALFVRAR